MKRLWQVGVGVLVFAFVGAAVGQVKIPPDFSFPQGEKSPGKVTFSHAFHQEKLGKCVACHVKVFKMKKGSSSPFTMARIQAGELCGTCHNGSTDVGGKAVFNAGDKANCARCHNKS